MTESAERTPFKRPGPRQIVWTTISIVFIISLILSIFAASNYTEIARASVLTYVATDETATLAFDDLGNLESVNMTLKFTVVNPSHMELRTWILTYKGWLRDIPMEDGSDISRWRVDGKVVINETQMRYYPVFVATYAFDNPKVIVPALSNVTITRYLEINQNNYPDILLNIASIYNHSANTGNELEWLHYTSSIIFIQDIPQFAGTNNDANLIRRFDGVDITPGVGGAGP